MEKAIKILEQQAEKSRKRASELLAESDLSLIPEMQTHISIYEDCLKAISKLMVSKAPDIALKPCPRTGCGGSAGVQYYIGSNTLHIKCKKCKFMTPVFEGGRLEQAVGYWNAYDRN